ncbi:hypothetical protein ACFFF5_17645 [Lederbergia wuyishanensis]|uniref:Uncharacterized protein n=1 Tax=Lederbergia wuyishanensis TaxID=1347903 RepID=A0ABU0DAT5_9BACI|nr:hypothetical protein [Lederbergia wuyishanensis]MCJ8009663.1 hypothetical protein [Lederbergia wuyishanensis]MDQ0345463.1 hypothetical protein [Lederbergia wuyishanensis]
MKKKKFNLAYMSATTYPILLIGFINKNWVVITLSFLLLASFIIGGSIQNKRQIY